MNTIFLLSRFGNLKEILLLKNTQIQVVMETAKTSPSVLPSIKRICICGCFRERYIIEEAWNALIKKVLDPIGAEMAYCSGEMKAPQVGPRPLGGFILSSFENPTFSFYAPED